MHCWHVNSFWIDQCIYISAFYKIMNVIASANWLCCRLKSYKIHEKIVKNVKQVSCRPITGSTKLTYWSNACTCRTYMYMLEVYILLLLLIMYWSHSGASSDTQWWFRSLHQPLGQLARKALKLPPKIDMKRYSVRSNQTIGIL